MMTEVTQWCLLVYCVLCCFCTVNSVVSGVGPYTDVCNTNGGRHYSGVCSTRGKSPGTGLCGPTVAGPLVDYIGIWLKQGYLQRSHQYMSRKL